MLSIVKQGRNGKESPLPYFMLFTQAFLWMMYGVLTHHPDIVRINGLSSVVSCCYLLVLAAHANSQERHLVTPGILGGIAAVFSGSVAVLAFVHDPLRKIQILSDTAMVFTLGLSAAPMLQVVDVWKNRSLEGFPVPLVAVGAVSCALWSEYAVMINSLPYLIPNVVGVALNLVQLVVVGYVYVVYERKSRPASKADAVAEEKALLKEQYQATQQTEEVDSPPGFSGAVVGASVVVCSA
eukprot:CAMPEP_0204387864 /NCGR_PEP_ID=MMETSP0469-20131031/59194_1 /ASSEMBLY_ACC=CAM_ASM_000384 /TAXON_ID=2969 /ORGANISM="Oxyrrhis marina" /LENGTH=238 /DNA_ID=CAMNT_0051381297 /DNA_START=362 /DNA_END=1075 /DNA_ORIENTATION=+